MKAIIENDFVYSEFLPMRGDKLEGDDGGVVAVVAGVSATVSLGCGNLTGLLYVLELVGMKGRFRWRKRQAAEIIKAFEDAGIKTEYIDENTDDKARDDILIGPDDV